MTPRMVVILGTPDGHDRRWLSASRIAGCLSRDCVEVLISEFIDIAGAGRSGEVLLLVDSDDAAGCSLIPEWSRRGASIAVVVVDPTRPLRVPAESVNAFLVESRWSAEYLLKAHGIASRVISPQDVRPSPRPDW